MPPGASGAAAFTVIVASAVVSRSVDRTTTVALAFAGSRLSAPLAVPSKMRSASVEDGSTGTTSSGPVRRTGPVTQRSSGLAERSHLPFHVVNRSPHPMRPSEGDS